MSPISRGPVPRLASSRHVNKVSIYLRYESANASFFRLHFVVLPASCHLASSSHCHFQTHYCKFGAETILQFHIPQRFFGKKNYCMVSGTRPNSFSPLRFVDEDHTVLTCTCNYSQTRRRVNFHGKYVELRHSLKVKNDHRSKFSNLSNGKEEHCV